MARATGCLFTKVWNKQIATERRQADTDWRRLHTLSHRQVELLSALSTTTWCTSPLGTKASTILSLQNRNLIYIQLANPIAFSRYADAGLRLTALGDTVTRNIEAGSQKRRKK